ncbi:MAG: radical SAM protein, partial [Calditrichaeota bacterium]
MNVTTQSAKTILRRQKRIDSWFISRYGMNLYRGCLHNCSYCDGRAEKYQVDGDFGRQVMVKINAVEVLTKEIASLRKRSSLKGGFIFIGGGVCDSYQPAEGEFQLTRGALELLRENNLPVHMLTKSVLIERDFELIREINQQKRAVVSMSFSSTDDEISSVFEPGASPPSARLKTLERFKQAGVAVGIYLLPIIPYITDSDVQLQRSFQSFKAIGAEWVVCGGMTMKDGRQFEYFNNVLAAYDPSLLSAYQSLYPGEAWGSATAAYTRALNRKLVELAAQFQLPMRIPPRLW